MRYNNQEIFHGYDCYQKMKGILQENNVQKFFLVCDSSYEFMFIKEYIASLGIPYVKFDGFTPNPLYDDIVKGIETYRNENCDFIVSVGGGSAIDVAKCIKLYVKMDDSEVYLKQEYKDSKIKHLAIPSTAGTGSESTRFAVCYYEGEKQSISHDSIIPDYAILEPKLLETLPAYQKKATMLDALCQAIESYWSVNSTDESKQFSREAITSILLSMDDYLSNGKEALEAMSLASNLSGRAINITQTTAAHAMSYKITSLFGTAHGHAVALCLPYVWEYMIAHPEKCIDSRGREYLEQVLSELNAIFNIQDGEESAAEYFKELVAYLEMDIPKLETKEQLEKLVTSVNPVRLRNFPVELSEEAIREIYTLVFRPVTDDKKKALAEIGAFNSKNYKTLHYTKALQQYVLEILGVVDEFCTKHNIPYYLGEGSLLGAVRHHGFIPWDDDVDLLMKREDYERFVELAKREFPEGYVLDCFETNKNHWTICAKVQMTRKTEFVSYKVGDLGLANGPSLDIFPLDKVPTENSVAQDRLGRKIFRYRRILWNKTGYSKPVKRIKWVIAKMLGYVIPKKWLDHRIISLMKTYHDQDCDYLVNFGSLYPAKRQTVHKDVYGTPKRVPFNHLMLPIPEDADQLLTKIYGNYMSLPPKEKRIAKHYFSIIQGDKMIKL